MWAEASVRWLKSDSQSPHINQSRSIDPDASHGSLKPSAGYPDPLDVPPPPLSPLSRYDPSSAFASDAVGCRASGTVEVAAQIGDRVFGAKPVKQILQRDQLAVATHVTADVYSVVVVHDALQGCRGIFLV
jgi:hypothetical protein